MKKVGGVIILIVGILLIISVIKGFFSLISEPVYGSATYKSGYVLGYIIAQILVCLAGIYLFRLGRKWIKKSTLK
jgi:hypothetical protein